MEKDNNNWRDSFICHRSYLALSLPEAERREFFEKVALYALDGIEPTFTNVYLEALWGSTKPVVDREYEKWLKRGGAPKGNRNNPFGRRGKETNQEPTQNQHYVDVSVSADAEVDGAAEPPSRSKQFIKPSLQDVAGYFASQHLHGDAAAFFDHYESVGWKVANAPMRDWQAAARNWSRREQTQKNNVKRIDPHHNLEGSKADAFESIEATV